MRHRTIKRHFRRGKDSRNALEKSLVKNVIEYEKVETTLAKAKFVRPEVEKLITISKVDSVANRRLLLKKLSDKKIVDKLLDDLGPRFKSRNGGYTRIRRTGIRHGDVAEMAQISFVEGKKKEPVVKEKKVAEKK